MLLLLLVLLPAVLPPAPVPMLLLPVRGLVGETAVVVPATVLPAAAPAPPSVAPLLLPPCVLAVRACTSPLAPGWLGSLSTLLSAPVVSCLEGELAAAVPCAPLSASGVSCCRSASSSAASSRDREET